MLEGKPSKQDDEVIMRAIKDILSDYEDDLPGLDMAPNARPAYAQSLHAQDELTLTPVKDIETKIRPAAFSTVPSEDTLAIRDPIIRTIVQKRENPIDAPTSKPVATRRRSWGSRHARVRGSLRRLAPRWIAIGVLFGCASLVPALVVIPIFATLVLTIGAFVLFGADRVWGAVARLLMRYEAHRPQKARRLMKRLDAFAVHWDAVLDRFPDGSVDGLYLPDFANHAAREALNETRLNARLDRMHRQV